MNDVRLLTTFVYISILWDEVCPPTPKFICRSPNLQYLRLLPYLETGLLKRYLSYNEVIREGWLVDLTSLQLRDLTPAPFHLSRFPWPPSPGLAHCPEHVAMTAFTPRVTMGAWCCLGWGLPDTVTDAYSVLSQIRDLWLNRAGPQKMSGD